jgi:hypothetical protein
MEAGVKKTSAPRHSRGRVRRGRDQVGTRRPDSVVLGSSAPDGAAETAPHLPALPDVAGRLPGATCGVATVILKAMSRR